MPAPARWLAMVGLLAIGAAQAQLHPVQEKNSTLTAVPDERPLAPAQAGTRLAPGSPRESFLRPVAAPESRLAEVQQLMQALQARQTPNRQIVIELPADVLFDFDRATLRPDAAPALQKAARLLVLQPGALVRVGGHTDALGGEAYNLDLSRRRAEAVAGYLRQHAPGSRLQVQGFGKSRPVAPNTTAAGADDPAGRQRNRRVEIVIEPPASTGGEAPAARTSRLR